jgi:hypothetical protein
MLIASACSATRFDIPYGGIGGNMNKSNFKPAMKATLHCLSGCAIGEILGLILGTVLVLSNTSTIILSVILAFFFGYLLTSLSLRKMGMGLAAIAGVALAADTFSIGAMEIADNTVMSLIPGAMNAGLVNPLFWITMPISLAIGFVAAVPVNMYLLSKGKGHCSMNDAHGAMHHG